MIIEIRAKNCFAFEEPIVFSMKADMRNKKLASNVHRENYFNVLKTAGIYGPNNAGKTCLVRCIDSVKRMLLNKKPGIMKNLFTKDPICDLGVTFLHEGRKFSYDIRYNAVENTFVYEKFVEILKDQYGNEKAIMWLEKDIIDKRFYCLDDRLNLMMPAFSPSSLLCYVVDTNQFDYLNQMKTILVNFAEKIDIINMNNIPMEKTISLMKDENGLQRKVVDFIKNADLYMDDFEYVEMDRIKINPGPGMDKAAEDVLNVKEKLMEQIRLISTYKGVAVPSLLFDSTGTKKIAAIASYIIEGLEEGRILVVDELDSSIHFKLTRAIVAMFNNELNTNAQMIFTVHDVNLMDCKKLLRKEQIWFVHKDEQGVYVYSLADFTAQQGVRDTTDIIEKYRKGVLGALPDPELICTLLDVKGCPKEEVADA